MIDGDTALQALLFISYFGSIFLLSFGFFGYLLYSLVRHMIYGPRDEPPTEVYDFSKDRVGNIPYALKMLEIEAQVDRAERSVAPPAAMPYKDGKKLVPKWAHDWMWHRPWAKAELQREDFSYYPFTLIEEKCGKAETPFEYDLPQQSVLEKRDRTWYCFKRENRWWWLK